MTWRPTKETEHWEAPPGIGPWRVLTDEEHDALALTYDGDLGRWYERAEPSEVNERRPLRARAPKED